MEGAPNLSERMIEGFKRLFPKMNPSCFRHPIRTAVVAATCNVAEYAFEAYKDPGVTGFTNQTVEGQQIRYLNYNLANDAFDGVLRIHLKEARNVKESDMFGPCSPSDPYVLFSVGLSCVKSTVVNNSATAVWGSTHYLVVRKEHVRKDDDGKMHVCLFDRDRWETCLQDVCPDSPYGDDLLGSAVVDLQELKMPGMHAFELKMNEGVTLSNTPMIVSFTVEYISFQDACMEMGIPPDSDRWSTATTSNPHPGAVPDDLPWIVELGSLPLDPIAFVHVPSTDTQAWLRVNLESKMLVVSFRGTETKRKKDILIDLAVGKQGLGTMQEDRYKLRPTEELSSDEIRVHSGFLRAYNSIREAILQVAYDVSAWHENWSIRLTGHSLGGALATLCAFEFANRRSVSGQVPLIGMLNYGSPRVGDRAFVKAYNKTVEDSFRIVDKDDVVHLLPPTFEHTAREMLCLPTGEAYVEGVPLEELKHMTWPRDTLGIVDRDDAGRLEEIIRTYAKKIDEMVDKHLEANYLSIIRAAVARFFEDHR